MSKNKRLLIILGIECLLIIGTGSLLSRSIAKTIQPLADPQLNQEALKEVMLFGASGTVGDGILKALLMDLMEPPGLAKIHGIFQGEPS